MPRANRVTPFGNREAVSDRGLMHGNRGDLHRQDGSISGRQWAGKAWICCCLERPGGGRAIFDTRGHYTPLFFLDEVTALASGHRPCAYCRRPAYNAFRSAWQAAGQKGKRASEIDAVLHAARLDMRVKRLRVAPLAGLPAGCMVSFNDAPDVAWLWTGEGLRHWSHSGYGQLVAPWVERATILTPEPLAGVLSAGYRPLAHPSAFA